ncbi:hypothetical protein [Paenibacillus sp. LHD-38]|uniref:hypothetical protein n=1 Tax=Paenibacillus sp. LHD-38 TaxID=3072143 RepID=UPI00280F7694|nr:hypothetical protein [Paenibacillus sp. LHD-38]MDQ8739082.1 hypothetical protein [Paenibacillus sp. LHD-38]
MKQITITNRELLRKAAVLRQHEAYAYQASYYLLEDEPLAARAASDTLAALLQDDSFYILSLELQKQQVKRMVIKHALQIKVSVLQPSQ